MKPTCTSLTRRQYLCALLFGTSLCLAQPAAAQVEDPGAGGTFAPSYDEETQPADDEDPGAGGTFAPSYDEETAEEEPGAGGTFAPSYDEETQPADDEDPGAGGTFAPSYDEETAEEEPGAGGTFAPSYDEETTEEEPGAGGTFAPSYDEETTEEEPGAGGTFAPSYDEEPQHADDEDPGAGGTFAPSYDEETTEEGPGAGGTFAPSYEEDTQPADEEPGAGGTFAPSYEEEPQPADDEEPGAGGTFAPSYDEEPQPADDEDPGAGGTFAPSYDEEPQPADDEDPGAGGTFAPSYDEEPAEEEPGAGGTFAPSYEEDPQPTDDDGGEDSWSTDDASDDYDESYYEGLWDDYEEAEEAEVVEEPPQDAVAETKGRIEGNVIDGEFNEPAVGITVEVEETGDSLQTGESGYFYFDLDPGVYTVRFRGLGFENQVYQIEVQAGETSPFDDVEMGVDRDTTLTMEVEAEIERGSDVAQMVERRDAATTRDAISSETISRTGDSSAKDAARRVVGVTLVDDKFLYVRGLGGRYTKVTMNSVPVPIILSTIPAVELDLLPTSLLSGLELFKVPEARLPGDFVGGLLNLQTSDYSRAFEISAGVSASFNSQTAFRDVTVNENRGSFDWLGYDDGTRELPGSFDGVFLTPAGFGQEGLTREEINALARELPNNFGTTERTAPPEFGGSIEMSDTIEFDSDSSLAYRLAFDYGQGFSRSEYESNDIPDNAGGEGGLVAQGSQTGNKSEYSSQIGALGSARYDIDDDNELQFVLFYTNVLEDSITSLDGIDNDDKPVRQSSYEFSRRNVLMTQLLGRHRDLPGEIELDYSFTVSRGRNYQPDRREVTYIDQTPNNGVDDFVFSRDAGSGFRLYRDLTQNEYDGRLNLEIPIGDQFLRRAVRLGGVGRYMTRSYETRRFRYLGVAGSDADLTRPVEEVLSDEEIGASIDFKEQTLATNPYEAWQAFGAGYAQIDWEFSESFRATAGVRFESMTQEIEGNTPDSKGRRVDFDVLPSTSMVYGFAEDMSLRLAYAASVARPSVRESSAATEFDYVRGFEIVGNPNLERTYVHNVDFRYEFFPSPSEVIAATVYYKHFIDHIEPVIQNLGGSIAYENTPSARSFGGELEVQIDWGEHVGALNGFQSAFNVAAIYSQVELDASCGGTEAQTSGNIFTNCERPMVGQAPVAFNSLIGYGRDDLYGLNLVYNMVGPLLLFPGANGQEDIYSSFYHDLDLTAFYQLHDNWKLKFKADNLLHWANREYFGANSFGNEGFLLEREQKGTTISVGIEFKFARADDEARDDGVRTESFIGGETFDSEE